MIPPRTSAAYRPASSSLHFHGTAEHTAVVKKAMDTIKHGGVDAVQESIASLLTDLANDKTAFHEVILSLTSQADQCSSPGSVRQEIIRQALGQQEDFNLNASGANGKTALDLAAEHNDLNFARDLLDKGADPDLMRSACTSDMRALLTSRRWKNLLYSHHNKQGWTDLDHAVYAEHIDEAQALLNSSLNGRSKKEAWLHAVQHNQRDILRALLILSSPEELQELAARESGQVMSGLHASPPYQQSSLQQALALKDAGLSAVIKEFPYQSPARSRVANLNGRASFTTSASIQCRHLAVYVQEQQAQNARIKPRYDDLGDTDAIAKNVLPDTEETFVTLRRQATETHLVSNARFGKFLADQFSEMERVNQSTKLMLITSNDHVMNLGLLIKNKDGKKSYVVKLYDPNYTNSGVRNKSSSVQTFEEQTMESYIPSARYYYDYAYAESDSEDEEEGDAKHEDIVKGSSMIYVRPEVNGQASAGMPSSSGTARMLTTCCPPEEWDPGTIIFLMEQGFAENLKQLRSHLATLPENKQVSLLGTANPLGMPPLYLAMEDNHAEAIKAYGELLEVIPKNRRYELLAANEILKEGEFNHKEPALYEAMRLGNIEAIKAYSEVLRSLYCESQPGKRQRLDTGDALASEVQDIFALVAGKCSTGELALYAAMNAKKAAAVKEYGELLKLLPSEMRYELLLASNEKEEPAFHAAMSFGDAATVKEYGDLLELVQPEKRYDLLISRNKNNKSGLAIALDNNKFDAITQYLDIVEKVAPGLPLDDIAPLLDELEYCRDHVLSSGLLTSNPDKYREMYKQLSSICSILVDLNENQDSEQGLVCAAYRTGTLERCGEEPK